MSELALYGPWAIAFFFVVKEGSNLILRLAKGERRSTRGVNGKELKELHDCNVRSALLIEQHGKLLTHIEDNGSMKFQKYEVGDRQWKKYTDKRLNDHSERIDITAEGFSEHANKIAMLLHEHEKNHPGG